MFDRASDGSLAQKPGPSGCVSNTGAGPCVDGTAALDGAQSVTVSPDGENAYVTATTFTVPNSNAVAVFDRAGDGTLTQSEKPGAAGCISDSGSRPLR